MSVPTYPASLTEEMITLLGIPAMLHAGLRTEDSPISVSLPLAAQNAAQAFQTVFDDMSIDGRIFLAHKATASKSIISALKNYTSIDVASQHELKSALKQGFSPDKIIATGPKSDRFLEALCAQEQIVIAIDSFSELQRLDTALKNRHTRVLLRLTRTVFNMPSIKKQSRFGFDALNLENAITFLENHNQITLLGVSFHLDSQSIEERENAVEAALAILLGIQQRGFMDATVLDIGGGYGSHFGVAPETYEKFESNVKEMVTGRRASFTWQSHRYGLSSNGTSVRGQLTNVDFPRQIVGADDLRSLLERKNSNGSTVAERLTDNLIELWVEPGAALCATAGVVAAEVIEVRECDGEYMVVVNAHRNQIMFEGNENVADPLLVPRIKKDSDPIEAYIVGHLCMENDFMTFRKIAFSQMPQAGDCIMWTHTGAYRSHFSASRSIGQPLSALYTLTAKNKFIKENA